LTDLLDLCDWLATTERGAAMASAHDYEQRGQWRRAERLVQDVLSREPHQLDALAFYSRLAYQLGDLGAADKAARAAFALAPESVSARIAVARVCLGRLDLSECANLLTEVRKTEPDNVHAQELATRSQTVRTIQEMAAKPQGLPRIALSAQEQSSGQLAPDTLALMVDLFKQYGVVQMDNMFTQDRIKGLQNAFEAKYGGYFGEGAHPGAYPDALCVGDKRHMLTMELDHVFGAEELVASRLVLPFMQQVLGEECILSAYTAVVSLPGSAPQEVHKDHVPLFDEQGWGLSLPSFAVQVVVPLLALDEVTGATRVYKGTQRLDQDSAAQQPHQDPVVPLGSCLLVDYSVAHCGMGNRSDKVRPILNLVYSRPWFRDCRNYHLQPALKLSQPYFNNASEAVQKLVGWTRSH
jgi:Phytanoyl-CoA dioxygenase (PhyH)